MQRSFLRRFFVTAVLVVPFILPAASRADPPDLQLTLKNHAFDPPSLSVPANQKVKLIIKNEDDSAAEFESYELNREKVVPAHGQITVFLDPLDPGTYPYFDDFHRDTTTGQIVAK